MNCLFCGVKLVGRRQKEYCSVQCSRAHRHELAKKKLGTNICEMCGKEFDVHRPSGRANRGEVKEGRFCSKKCYGVWMTKQEKKPKASKERLVNIETCDVCGKKYIKKRKSKHNVCSGECAKEKARKDNFDMNSARKVLKARSCKECNKTFTPEYGNKRRHYCSDTCLFRNTRRRRRQKERALIRSVKVETVDAMRVFERDGWRCRLCGKKLKPKHRGTIKYNAPELDHIIPLSKGGEHSYRNTQCACRKCNAEKGAREFGQLRLFG